MCFLVLRQRTATVQGILFVGEECSKQMVSYAAGISKESVVDVEAEVVAPQEKIVSTSQQVLALICSKGFVSKFGLQVIDNPRG